MALGQYPSTGAQTSFPNVERARQERYFRRLPEVGRQIPGRSSHSEGTSMKRATFLLFLGSVIASPIVAQKPAVPLVAQTIDETQVVRLHGSVHPLAQPRYDRVAVPDAFPAERVLLLLNRPAERESALQEFLGEVHRRESTSQNQK